MMLMRPKSVACSSPVVAATRKRVAPMTNELNNLVDGVR
jgi:hypothetical protein